jgi:DNA damage-inducible protein 1
MDLKALIEIELQVPVSIQQLIHNGRHLQGDLASLISLGIQNDDMILVQSFQSEAETVRQKILNNPTLKTQFINQNPGLDRALQDPQGFERIYNEMQRQAKEQQTRQAQLYSADPFDIEAQRKIEEEIRKENIARNYETAIEHNPEFFGRVIMLYINVEINGVAVKAFVDSGAQASIMSPECAQNCNIMKFLDERFAGI